MEIWSFSKLHTLPADSSLLALLDLSVVSERIIAHVCSELNVGLKLRCGLPVLVETPDETRRDRDVVNSGGGADAG